MLTTSAVAPSLLVRARADQVATLYRQWHRTTLSMALGAALLCTVLWQEAALAAMVTWIAAIITNQAWRGALVAAYRRTRPGLQQAARWGAYWSVGSTLAGALWGAAAVVLFPTSHAHQALLIVCLFSVVLGGLNLTAVYKPAFYGFVLTALVPLVTRVAWEGDQVHLFTALVMLVVLVFVLTYGHHLNDLLTQSLAMRYENTDLIAELTAQSAAAEVARNAAETANRAKSQFLAAASHDLRQPLHALGLFAAALAARAREPTIQPLVKSIHASVEALESLFGQLLDLSRLEAGALRPDVAPVPLQPLLSRLASDFAAQTTAAGISLRARPTDAVIITDALLLERILRNLIGNAVRYTREGGILIGTRRRGSNVRIEVIDTGVGIAPGDQQRIFEEFVQLDGHASRMRRGHGLGLGLAIVRRLGALLEHDITLRSVPGRGSKFSVTAARAVAHRTRSGRADNAEPRSEAAAPDDAFLNRRVVIIDDDPGVIAAMDALFTTWGATVVAAEDGHAACHNLQQACAPGKRHADLIVADLRLADGLSGIDAIRTLRQDIGTPTPALIISGDTTEGARAEAARSGIALLQKPVMAAALLAAALRALAVCDADAAHIDHDMPHVIAAAA